MAGAGWTSIRTSPEGHQHQSQAIARAAARLAGGPQFHAYLNTELGVGHLLGLLSGAHDFTLYLGPMGMAPAPWSGRRARDARGSRA